MAADLTPVFATYFARNRGPVPGDPENRQPPDFGMSARLDGAVVELALVFRAGSAYCCSQWGCHLNLDEGKRWEWLRRELSARRVEAPPRLELRLTVVIEAGAMFFDFRQPGSIAPRMVQFRGGRGTPVSGGSHRGRQPRRLPCGVVEMTFNELVRTPGECGLLTRQGKGLGQILQERRVGATRPGRLSWQQGGSSRNLPIDPQSRRPQVKGEGLRMLDLPYSLVIEATDEPDFFGFYSPDLEGFTGIGHSIEDCLYQARWGMKEYVELLAEWGLPIPSPGGDPTVLIRNAGKAPADKETAPSWWSEPIIA